MKSLNEAKDIEFAYKVKRALNESAENIPEATLNRLSNARKLALSRKKQESTVAVFASKEIIAGNAGFTVQGPISWFGKLGVALPMLVLVIGLFGIYEYEQNQRINDLAEIDAAVLVDELPPDAYLDTGFSAYLNKVEE
jgi:hypothetical protein